MTDKKQTNQTIVLINKKPFRKASLPEIKVCSLLAQLKEKNPEIHWFQVSFDDYMIDYIEGCPMIVGWANLFLLMSKMFRFFSGKNYTCIAMDLEKIYSAILDTYEIHKKDHLDTEFRKWCYNFSLKCFSDYDLKLSYEKGNVGLYRDLLLLEKLDEYGEEYKFIFQTIMNKHDLTENQLQCFEDIPYKIGKYGSQKPQIKKFLPILESLERQFNLVLPD
jgi:hypothetical protein